MPSIQSNIHLNSQIIEQEYSQVLHSMKCGIVGEEGLATVKECSRKLESIGSSQSIDRTKRRGFFCVHGFQDKNLKIGATFQEIAIGIQQNGIALSRRVNQHFAQRDDGCSALYGSVCYPSKDFHKTRVVLGMFLDEVDDRS